MLIPNLVLLPKVACAPKMKLYKGRRGSFVNANHFSLDLQKHRHLTKGSLFKR